MDEISTKAISIGVAIFITIIIVSGIFYVINQMKVIYEQVYETDISIQSMFSEFDAYDNAEKTGIDVINAIKKYDDNPSVNINMMDKTSTVYATYYGNSNNTDDKWGKYENYVKYSKNEKSTDEKDLKDLLTTVGTYKYISNVSFDESTGITTITFKQK